MSKFIKENIVLLIGISLPILLMIIFILASTLPKLWVAAPKYDFLYISYSYNNTPSIIINVDINDRKLQITARHDPANKPSQTPRLFIYEMQKQTSREITIPMPNITPNTTQLIPIIIPELQNATIDTSWKSPDGFSLFSQYQYGGGDFNGLFFSSYDKNNAFTLKKDGYVMKISFPQVNIYNVRFLGWIISK